MYGGCIGDFVLGVKILFKLPPTVEADMSSKVPISTLFKNDEMW